MWYVVEHSDGMQYYMQQEADHMVNNAYVSKQATDSEGSC